MIIINNKKEKMKKVLSDKEYRNYKLLGNRDKKLIREYTKHHNHKDKYFTQTGKERLDFILELLNDNEKLKEYLLKDINKEIEKLKEKKEKLKSKL